MTAPPVRVRDEASADRTAIREVVSAAFGRPDEADLVAALRHAGDVAISLVATEPEKIVAHLVLSRMRAPFRALGLGPVSVLPARQGQGIGSRLIRAGLARAVRDGWQGVFVLGEPGFYGRFGFDAALAAGFASPYAGPYLMAWTPYDGLPVAKGRIDYPPAFADLG